MVLTLQALEMMLLCKGRMWYKIFKNFNYVIFGHNNPILAIQDPKKSVPGVIARERIDGSNLTSP